MPNANLSVDELNQNQTDRQASSDVRATKKVLAKKNSLTVVQTKIRQNIGSHIIRNCPKNEMVKLEQEILLYQRRWKADPSKYPMGLKTWNVWRDKVAVKSEDFPSDPSGMQSSVLKKLLESGDTIKVAAYIVSSDSGINKRGWCALLRFIHHQPNIQRRDLVTNMVGAPSMATNLVRDVKGAKIVGTLIEDTLLHNVENKGVTWKRSDFFEKNKKLVETLQSCYVPTAAQRLDIKATLTTPDPHKEAIMSLCSKSEFFTKFFAPAVCNFKTQECLELCKKIVAVIRNIPSTQWGNQAVVDARGKLFSLISEIEGAVSNHERIEITEKIGGMEVKSGRLVVSEAVKFRFEAAVIDKCAKSIVPYFDVSPHFTLEVDQLPTQDAAEIGSKHADTLERLQKKIGKDATCESVLTCISNIRDKKETTSFYRDNKYFDLVFQWVEKSLQYQKNQLRRGLIDICTVEAVSEKSSIGDICDKLERKPDESYKFFNENELLDDLRRLVNHLGNRKDGDYPTAQKWTEALEEDDKQRLEIEDGLLTVLKTTRSKIETFTEDIRGGQKTVAKKDRDLVELTKPIICFVDVNDAVDVMLKRAKKRTAEKSGKKKQKVEDEESKIDYWG